MLCVGALVLLALLLVVPVLSLIGSVSFDRLGSVFASPDVQSAIWLSSWTSLVSLTLIVVLGTPAAYWIARTDHPAADWIEMGLILPLVLPPAVAGLALLRGFGGQGWITLLPGVDRGLSFSAAAVVLAQMFVSAPIYIRASQAVFEQIPPIYENVARTLGANPMRAFRQVVLPMALPGLLAAGALTWARALGEFGATLLFAGNLPGVTQTMPTAIYVLLESNGEAADALSVLLIAVAVAALLVVKYAERRWKR